MNKPPNKRIAGFSAGMLFTRSLRRVIRGAGYSISVGWLGGVGDSVAVWGRIPRSRWVLQQYQNQKTIVTFEDAFIRSISPGLSSPPLGLNVDKSGVYFDCETASDLENILNFDTLDEPTLLHRARSGRAFLKHYGLSKYNPTPRGGSKLPSTGYTLVVDQVRGDASVTFGRANEKVFNTMLAAAKAENPENQIIIRAHPAALSDDKAGYFSKSDAGGNVSLFADPANPWDVLENAKNVYCVTSQMGFEAILAGHRPHVFGIPFYAGWGLSDDRQVVPRRGRSLTGDQLFAASMLIYPYWHSQARDSGCSFEEATQEFLTRVQEYWHDTGPSVALEFRLWKRASVAGFFGKITFSQSQENAIALCIQKGQSLKVWAGKESSTLADKCEQHKVQLDRVEDGFIRSQGLGAELVPASSLVVDDIGIYYDPSRPSRLEQLISSSVNLPPVLLDRALKLREKIVSSDVSKYNLKNTSDAKGLPENVILVVGQVEDDASILKGAGGIRTNLGLLRAVRKANPDGYIVYKPHPDVVAGLRIGAVRDEEMVGVSDCVSTVITLDQCAELWTMTSLMGFEALLRGVPVTCVGTPFYAGWGLTNDLGTPCERRRANITLDQLVHATLIDYPRYRDPVSGKQCNIELLVDRMAEPLVRQPTPLKILAKLQGVFASFSVMWR